MPSLPSPATAAPALHGVRVIDLTTVVFGPYATQTLADYGAEVVKVEAPEGDSTRVTGPTREPGMASVFLGANRNKKSVVLDLKTEAGRAQLQALIAGADVFVHNVRPQKLAALGLSPEALLQRHPRLVYAGLHGFGEDGPYAGQPAYDDIIQALSGLAGLVGQQQGRPGYLPTIAADKVCAHMAVHAILAALFQRERTGRGQLVEVPMLECMASFVLVEHLFERHLRPDGAFGYARAVSPLRRPLATRDGHVCLMPYTDTHWRRLLTEAGRADLLDDPRFVDIASRTRNIDAVYGWLTDEVARHDTAYWLARAAALDIPCAPLRQVADLEHDPHLQAVGLLHELSDDRGGHYTFTRAPVRLSASQVAPQRPPRLGEHTAEVLAALAAVAPAPSTPQPEETA